MATDFSFSSLDLFGHDDCFIHLYSGVVHVKKLKQEPSGWNPRGLERAADHWMYCPEMCVFSRCIVSHQQKRILEILVAALIRKPTFRKSMKAVY